MLFVQQPDVELGWFGADCFLGFGLPEAEFDLLFFAEQVTPVAVEIPFGAVGFDGMLDAFATVAALQIVGAAVFVAAPADAVGVFGKNGKFFGHDVHLVMRQRCVRAVFSLCNANMIPGS